MHCSLKLNVPEFHNELNDLSEKKKKSQRNVSSFLSKESPAITPLYPWQLSPVNAHVSV